MAVPDWVSYVGLAGGVLGTATGCMAYWRTGQLKALDLRLELSRQDIEVRHLVLGLNDLLAQGVPLFLMQFSGIATPSIHAGFGFRPAPTRNPHKINHLLTGPFPASTDTDRRMGLTAGKGGKPPRNRVGRDGRMTPRSRRPGDVCRWCAYRGPRGIWSLVQPSGPLSKQIGYAVRHCEGESDRNAAVGMSRCA
jgi:hypothetical protein